MFRVVITSAAFTAALVAVTAWPASAQGPQRGMGGGDAASMIERADANGDGAVSRDELRASRSASFARLDRDGDGVFMPGDMPDRAAGRPRVQQLVDAAMRFDVDGDGAVTQVEFVNGPTAGFDLADTDGDDVVSAAEIEALKAMAAQARSQ